MNLRVFLLMQYSFMFLFIARLLVVVVALSGLFLEEKFSSLLLLVIFIASHWLVDLMVDKKRLRKQWHNKNFFLSSIGVLFLFLFLLWQECIPMILAAIFFASIVIKTLFMG